MESTLTRLAIAQSLMHWWQRAFATTSKAALPTTNAAKIR
jgi:hypothetical protein